jgi:FkbM family methyltransferase
MKYCSQYKQDEFINKVVLNNKRNGFFIDIGAHNGVLFSNSYFFEKQRNFRGICIEPNPIVFGQLSASRTSKNINACIGKYIGKADFLLVEGYGEMLSGLIDSYVDEHLNRIDQIIKQHGGEKRYIEVDVITIDSLKRDMPNEVDFCSIDTEGNELSILETIDFSKLNIKCFTIENNYHDSAIDKLMRENNYTPIIELGCDYIYVKESEVSVQMKVRLHLYKLGKKFSDLISRIREVW